MQTRIRVPEHWYGDYIGMIGAARVGERELLKIGEEVGWDAFDELRRRTGSTTARSACARRSATLPSGQPHGP